MKKTLLLLPLVLLLSACELGKTTYSIYTREYDNTVAVIGNLAISTNYSGYSSTVGVTYRNLSQNKTLRVDLAYVRFLDMEYGDVSYVSHGEGDFVLEPLQSVNELYIKTGTCTVLSIRANNFQYNVRLFKQSDYEEYIRNNR